MIAEINNEGIKIYRYEKSPLSKERKKIEIDREEWSNNRINVEMKVRSIEPTFKGDRNEFLDKITLEVDEISKNEINSETFWKTVESELGIVKKDNEIKLNGDKPGKNNLLDFVRFLLENEYLKKSEIPISSGYKRYLINIEPVNKEGGKMANPAEVEDGIYLETNFSRNQIKEKIKELGKRFGRK